MVEEEKGAPDAPAAAAAEPAKETKSKKGGSDKQVGKFTNGDHMVHILLEKAKKFVPANGEDR